MVIGNITSKKWIVFVVEILILLGVIGLAVRLYGKIESGHGYEHYIAMSGIKLNYYQAFYSIVSIPFIIIFVTLLAYYLNRDERGFKKKYNISKK